jgi:hypothetical protein
MLQTVNVRFYAGNTDPERFERLFEQVADVVHARLDSLDPSVGAIGADRFIDVMLTVEADGPAAAVNVALDTIMETLEATGAWPEPLVFKSIEVLETV